MPNCLFCDISEGRATADIVYEDKDVLAFKDISPKAPVHLLIIPRGHISTINDLGVSDRETIGKLFLVAKTLASSEDIAETGYRVVMNCNDHGGQSVYHIHLHLLGGRPMKWPPG